MPSRRSSRGSGLRAAEREVQLLTDIFINDDGMVDFFKSAGSGLLGLPADLLQMSLDFNAAYMRSKGLDVKSPDVPLDTPWWQEAFGAESGRPSSIAGEILAPGPGDIRPILGMTLFHGTPHRFRKFNLSKIGTGEGAQAYGHGLYFAESPGVARSYQANLSGAPAFEVSDALYDASPELRKAIGPVSKNQLRSLYAQSPDDFRRFVPQKTLKAVDKKFAGHLYEVDIPDETINKMLDWDAPLSEQPEAMEKIRGLLAKRDMPRSDDYSSFIEAFEDELNADFAEWTGRDAYAVMRKAHEEDILPILPIEYEKALRPEEGASLILNEAGIPGIRYYDATSRKAKEGTRNIVLFDEDAITQVKRDGELVFQK